MEHFSGFPPELSEHLTGNPQDAPSLQKERHDPLLPRKCIRALTLRNQHPAQLLTSLCLVYACGSCICVGTFLMMFLPYTCATSRS